MKTDIDKIFQEILELLAECALLEESAWFKAKKDVISRLPEGSNELKNELRSVGKILAGMGSFSDLPMIPKAGSKLTQEKAEHLQMELTERLFQEIKNHT